MKRTEIGFNPEVKVFEDKKTHVRTVAMPFVFPDGVAGAVMVTRLKNETWKPDIKQITIDYV